MQNDLIIHSFLMQTEKEKNILKLNITFVTFVCCITILYITDQMC